MKWFPLSDVGVSGDFSAASGDSDTFGIFSGFNIYYLADGESLRRQYDVKDVAAYIARLTGLSPFTYYTITMNASTGGGLSLEGPDPPLRVRTEEDGQII